MAGYVEVQATPPHSTPLPAPAMVTQTGTIVSKQPKNKVQVNVDKERELYDKLMHAKCYLKGYKFLNRQIFGGFLLLI